MIYSQSNIVYDAGTTIDMGIGADICADSIKINGTFSGNGTFCNALVAVENEDDLGTPKKFGLSQNFPNPFNPSTTINFLIPKSSFVNLKIYDILGHEVATLVNEEKPAGIYNITFNAGNLSNGKAGLASGVYFYQLKAGNYVATKKLDIDEIK